MAKCDSCVLRHWRVETKDGKYGPYCAANGESPKEGEDYNDCKVYEAEYLARQWKPRNG